MNDTNIGPMPAFLVRDTRTTATRRAPRKRSPWQITKGMKEATRRERRRLEFETARGPVLAAVRAGADTLGKIRKATGLENLAIKSALNHYIGRRIRRVGKRYSPVKHTGGMNHV